MDPTLDPGLAPTLTEERRKFLAELILAAVGREYPSHVSHAMSGDHDARPPRELTPAFFGSFDWHSAVHGHWSLARLVRIADADLARAVDAPPEWISRARSALAASLEPRRIEGELTYFRAPGREGFERPYGLAWLLQLAAELGEWSDSQAQAWSQALAPLEALAAERLDSWLARLAWPIRSGEHAQSAFALGLALDWARGAGGAKPEGFAERIVAKALAHHRGDRLAPIAYEPSGHDFLSPILGQADLMRRVLDPGAFAGWLDGFLPELDSQATARWLEPVASTDRTDGKLAHLDGLNLSRAWMLDGIAAGLPESDARRGFFAAHARRHREVGLAAVSAQHYAGAHWLGSFAIYAWTRRGIPARPASGASR